MPDWGPVFVAVVLFILLTPGLLIQMPGQNRFVEFGNFQTGGLSILEAPGSYIISRSESREQGALVRRRAKKETFAVEFQAIADDITNKYVPPHVMKIHAHIGTVASKCKILRFSS
ncbi:uncharacterized protein LOC111386910 [Olea europaea subsp. europaea]|uniref:Uncharacterized protein LOC111386910 n=1 Tax=Olea europaea subsp. europaea TaxID=158383 RepID=A0A8S0RYX1_OLEEU|nr:uncharacterized protein LOC111386910 [Olea europaea subsp. europaea]